MAIKQLLELVGDDIVIAKLGAVQKKGEEVLGSFNKQLPDLKLGIDAKPLQEFTGHATKLSDILKILKPALHEAGVAVGGLGTFGRLASVSFAGLAAALTGAVIVKLADVEESAAKTKASLSDLFGSTAAGEKAFKALEASAKSLSTTTAELLPSLESLIRGLDKFNQAGRGFKFVALKREDLPIGFTPDIEKATAALTNFFKVLRASGLDTAQAAAAEKEFFAALRSGGQLTADILNKLPTGTVEALAVALGKGSISAEQFIAEVAKVPIPIDKVAKSLAAFTKQAQESFDTKAVRSYKDAFADLLKGLEQQLKSATGKGFSDFLIDAIDQISKGIQTSIEEIKKIIDLWKATFNIVKAPPIPGISAPAGEPAQDQKDLVNKFVQSSKRGTDQVKADNKSAAAEVGNDWETSFNKMINDINLWANTFGKAAQAAQSAAPKFKFLTPPAAGEDPFAGKKGGITPTTGTVPIIQGATFTGKPDVQSIGLATFTGNVTFASFAQPGFPPGGGGRIPPPPEFRKASLEDGGEMDGGQLVESFRDAEAKIEEIWTQLLNFLSTSLTKLDLSGVTSGLVLPFEQAVPGITSAINTIIAKIDELLRKIQEASFAGAFSGGGFGGQAEGAPFARGGMVSGHGSTTSDSILAWLSNREFVVNARAVSHYGPDLFAALNAMRLPKDFISRFSMGGLARALSTNRFAAGGQVSTAAGNRSLTLVLDQKRFSMSGSKQTIDDLEREASLRELAMIGKAPSWIR